MCVGTCVCVCVCVCVGTCACIYMCGAKMCVCVRLSVCLSVCLFAAHDQLFLPFLEKFKEKKAAVVSALRETMDAMLTVVSLDGHVTCPPPPPPPRRVTQLFSGYC